MQRRVVKYTSTSIYDAASVCKDLFMDVRDQCQRLPRGHMLHSPGIKLFVKFRIWLDNTTALSPPRQSLDARLVDRPEMVRRICEMLAMIERNLHEAKIQAEDANNGVVPSEDKNDDDDDDDDDDDYDEPGFPAIEGALEVLASIWVTIQLMGKRNRTKPVSGALPLPETEPDFYIARIQDLFPNANSGVAEHIGMSVYTRGKEMLYLRRKNIAAGGPPNAHIGTKWPSYGHPDHCRTNPATTATESHITCTICQDRLAVDELTNEAWMKHVGRDVLPYVCLSEACANPFHFFDNLEGWIGHMVTRHSTAWASRIHSGVWTCELDHGTPGQEMPRFHDEEAFEEHLRDAHRVYGADNLQAVYYCRKTEHRDRFSCLLCGTNHRSDDPDVSDAENLRRTAIHIGEHLRQLALESMIYLDSSQHGYRDFYGFEMVHDQEKKLRARGAERLRNAGADAKAKTLNEERYERQVHNSSPDGRPSYIYPPNWNFPAGGPIDVGNIILHPLCPEQALMTVDGSDPGMLVTAYPNSADQEGEIKRLAAVQESFLTYLAEDDDDESNAQRRISLMGQNIENIQMSYLDTIIIQTKPNPSQVTSWMFESKEGRDARMQSLVNDMTSPNSRIKNNTLYMISGVKIARGFQQRLDSKDPKDAKNPLWTEPRDIVFAYEVMKICMYSGTTALHVEVYEFPGVSGLTYASWTETERQQVAKGAGQQKRKNMAPHSGRQAPTTRVVHVDGPFFF